MNLCRARKRLTAWLGLVAMALIFCAPVVSQWLASQTSFALAMPRCEAVPSASTSSHVPADHGASVDLHAACGYCNLLAHHVPAPAPVAPSVLAAPTHTLAWTTAAEPLALREAQRSGRPRDSPFLT